MKAAFDFSKRYLYGVLAFISLLSFAVLVSGTGYTAGRASHSTLFTDTIQGKNGGSVTVMDKLGVGSVPGGDEQLAVNFADQTWGIHFLRGATNLGGFHANGGIPTINTGTPGILSITGNVGIGTITPSTKLDVVGGARVGYLYVDPQDNVNEGGEIQLQGTGGNSGFQIDNYAGNARIFTLAAGKYLEVLGGNLYVDGAGTNYLNGNLGIGTSTPPAWAKLDVKGALSVSAPVGGLNTAVITSEAGGVPLLLKARGGDYPDLVVSNNGNVGIGVVNPAQKLEVVGTAQVGYLAVDPGDGGNEGGEIQLRGAGGNGGFQIDNYAGNARIHTLAAGKNLQVLGGGVVAAGNVQGSQLCIGNDCRSSWPQSGNILSGSSCQLIQSQSSATQDYTFATPACVLSGGCHLAVWATSVNGGNAISEMMILREQGGNRWASTGTTMTPNQQGGAAPGIPTSSVSQYFGGAFDNGVSDMMLQNVAMQGYNACYLFDDAPDSRTMKLTTFGLYGYWTTCQVYVCP